MKTTTDNEMLDPERERLLLNRVAADRHDQDAICELAAAYDPLAKKLARVHERKWDITSRDGRRDVLQGARMLLLESIVEYSAECGVKFSTFAWTRIEKRLERPDRNCVQWDDDYDYDKDTARKYRLSGMEDGTAHNASRASDVANRLLGGLSDRSRKAVCWHYGIGVERLTEEQIGRRLNLSESRVSRIIKEAINEMRALPNADTLFADIVRRAA